MVNVTIEEAYEAACLALGEATVRERLLSRELSARDAADQAAAPAPTT